MADLYLCYSFRGIDGRSICAILSEAVLILDHELIGTGNVSTALSGQWSKHRSGSRILLTISQHNYPMILNHELNPVIDFSLN